MLLSSRVLYRLFHTAIVSIIRITAVAAAAAPPPSSPLRPLTSSASSRDVYSFCDVLLNPPWLPLVRNNRHNNAMICRYVTVLKVTNQLRRQAGARSVGVALDVCWICCSCCPCCKITLSQWQQWVIWRSNKNNWGVNVIIMTALRWTSWVSPCIGKVPRCRFMLTSCEGDKWWHRRITEVHFVSVKIF